MILHFTQKLPTWARLWLQFEGFPERFNLVNLPLEYATELMFLTALLELDQRGFITVDFSETNSGEPAEVNH